MAVAARPCEERNRTVPYRVIATLKSGKVLEVEFADRETVDAELRCIDRGRRFRVGLPEIFWRTTDGERWCFAATEIVGELEVQEALPAAS